MWKTGHSLIKAKLKETGAPLAGEMSGHVFFKERWYGFDDALYVGARLLEILSRHEVKATFFVLADNARRYPDVLRSVAAHGHTVAVHGTSHAKLHHAGEAQIETELTTAVRELEALGVSPVRLYRPPHGLKNSAVFRVADKLGFRIWAWSRGIWDTDRPAPEVLVRRATRFACSGMVLLLHDGRGTEPQPDIEPMLFALPQILERLHARGFSFVTLDQA